MRVLELPRVIVLVAIFVLAGCHRTSDVHQERGTSVDGGTVVVSAASASVAPTPSAIACIPDSKGAVVIPDSARATEIRIAAAGSKALVTFWESTKRTDGPGVDTALGHLFDASTRSVGPRTKFEENDIGDMPVSGAMPVALSDDLFAISCSWAAPAGTYACTRAKPGEKPTSLLAFSGIANGGPEKPDIAAVVKGEDTLVIVPVRSDLKLFSVRVSAKTKGSPFAVRMDDGRPLPAPESLAATLSADDEVTVVYRHNGAIKARRAGFDQNWRGNAIDLSEKGSLVGAPSIASEPGHVLALFSQRAKASDPWKVVVADLSPTGQVKRSELPTGSEQAQGPGIAKTAEPGCYYASWVEGRGKSTRTKLARVCNGTIVPSSLMTLSTDGVEGGRAYLATSPASPTALFAVWQEIPAGKPAELRVTRLTCR
jgi:hypothetical protein